MTGIVDYNAGNIRSVARALQFLGTEYKISKDPEDLENVEQLIFPGVGEARYAMAQLKASGFDVFLKSFAASKRPILGICLGSQVLLHFSQEGDTECLGLLPGTVDHFPVSLLEYGLKIPHMGWNAVHQTADCSLFAGIPDNANFYFVHSYYLNPTNSAVVAGVAEYGMDVPCVLHNDSLFAVQFHPEKSGTYGMRMLRNFCSLKGTSQC